MKYLFLVGIVFLFICCQNPQKGDEAQKSMKYFPDSIIPDTVVTNLLSELNEKPLYNTTDKDFYRVLFIPSPLWIPTTLIRIEKNPGDSSFNICSKIPQDKMILTNKYELNFEVAILPQVDYWDTLSTFLNECDFWNLSKEDELCGIGVFDGGLYIFEAKINNKYNCIIRYNPYNKKCYRFKELERLISFGNYLSNMNSNAFWSNYEPNGELDE